MKKKPFFVLVGGEGTGKSTLIRALREWLQKLGMRVIITREPGGTPPAERLRSVAMKRVGDEIRDEVDAIDMHLAALSDLIRKTSGPTDKVADRVYELSKQRTLTPDLQLTLFIAARVLHVQEIIGPFLSNDLDQDVLFSDRFWQCSYAYQIFTGLRDLHDIEMADFFYGLFDWHLGFLLQNQVRPEVIFLDVDPEVGLQRVGMRNDERTSFDDLKLSYHWSLRHGYHDLLRYARPGHPILRYNMRMHRVDTTPSREEVFKEVKTLITSILGEDYQINVAVA